MIGQDGVAQRITPANEDNRRAIYEIEEFGKEFKVFRVWGGNLGNHYHEKKRELFWLIQGTATLITENVETRERRVQVFRQDEVVFIAPGVAHLFEFAEPAIMIAREWPYDLDDVKKYPLD